MSVSGHHRGCRALEEYEKNENVLIIYAKDIKPEEKEGEIPEQGYVWE